MALKKTRKRDHFGELFAKFETKIVDLKKYIKRIQINDKLVKNRYILN